MSELQTHTEMTVKDFLALGLRDLAYVKPASVTDGETTELVFEIHIADGTPVGTAATRELAFAAIRQNGLEPVSAH